MTSPARAAGADPDDACLLQTHDLSVRFGGLVAVDSVSVTMRPA